MAPFKLPQEYVDIMGGVNGEKFVEFKSLLKKAFMTIRKSVGNLILLIEMMQRGKCTQAMDHLHTHTHIYT